MQDVDSVNLVELSDAVSELKQRDVVNCHPERLMRAQDLHLGRSRMQIKDYFYLHCELAYMQCTFRKKINPDLI